MRNQLLFGRCEQHLPRIERVDAIITDPPYGLGKKEPTPEEIDLYLSGQGTLDTGDFMGKAWEIPSVPVWKECLRILKPGGLLMSFAGTRTADLISLGIQAAGFKKLGTILWIHGQGFPKGGNVSKAIDKKLKKTRKIIGPDPEAKRRNKKTPRFNGQDYANGEIWQGAQEVPLTAPASPEAELWNGWGTQLKPAWEPVMVFSKGIPTRYIDFSDPFFYCAKANRSETTLSGEIDNDHPCLHPDALVLTERGYRPIHSIRQGDKVYVSNGTFQRVTEVSWHRYMSSHLYQLSVRGTPEDVLASDNHPFLIWRPHRVRNRVAGGRVMWLRADQIQRGDYTMTPILREGVGSLELPSDPDFWFAFGLYLAEGHLQKAGHGLNEYPRYSLHRKEEALVDRLSASFGVSKVKVYANGENGIQVLVSDARLGALFKALGGCGAGSKSMAPIVWSLTASNQRAIFDGWVVGDGGRVRFDIQAKTVSADLAAQMQLLGEAAGFRSRVQRSEALKGAGIGDRLFKTTQTCHQLNFSRGTGRNGPNRIEHDGTTYTLRIVRSVSKVPYEGDVINLSVDGMPTFQTPIGMSHNTKKPLKLMRHLVSLASDEGQLVLDPYVGSGTTIEACLLERRDYLATEMDPKFFAIAYQRTQIANRPYELASLLDELPQEEG